ncbi:siderophore-interacting protein [Streptomyces sp. NPDC012769]|uniref:siderophore-interacting protein n=1 Tax=Streptomyces sp. NPDC012769 TaxID=3364848 RepID=UPI0036D0BB1A
MTSPHEGQSLPLPLRHVRVVAVRPLTPRRIQVTLPRRPSPAPDAQVQLFFPRPGQAEPVLPAPDPDPDGDVVRRFAAYGAIPEERRPWMRSYTVRARDPVAGTVDVDFLVHGGARTVRRRVGRAGPGPGTSSGCSGPRTTSSCPSTRARATGRSW